jgi:hypothetical protein
MSRAATEKEIEGVKYTVSPLPPRQALRMLARLGKLAGPAIEQFASAAKGSKGLGDLDVVAAGKALAMVFTNAEPEEFERIVTELLGSLTRGGVPVASGALDIEMLGKVDVMLELAAFALRVNYGSFSGALRRLGVAQGVVPVSAST